MSTELSTEEKRRVAAGWCACGCDDPSISTTQPFREMPAGAWRHPVLLAFACTRLADACVKAIWHDSNLHRTHCFTDGCKYRTIWQRRQKSLLLSSLVLWRKQEIFRLDGYPASVSRAVANAEQLTRGVPLWEICSDMEALWRELRHLADALDVAHRDLLTQVREYTSRVLTVIVAAAKESA